jgi:hypothetical protein
MKFLIIDDDLACIESIKAILKPTMINDNYKVSPTTIIFPYLISSSLCFHFPRGTPGAHRIFTIYCIVFELVRHDSWRYSIPE